MLLFGGSQNYDYGGAEFTRITPGRSWGDVELCARFDRLDLDSQGVYGGAANAWALGVNYYVNPNIKFMLNWQYVKNNKYANGNGKLVVGYNAEGAPTTNPADIAPDSSKVGLGYNMLACRMEVNF
jgi:phosphate-selective porin OprO/OprP